MGAGDPALVPASNCSVSGCAGLSSRLPAPGRPGPAGGGERAPRGERASAAVETEAGGRHPRARTAAGAMSSKVRKCKEQARVTFPAPAAEEEDEDEGAEPQRRRRGWRGVNGGLEPRSAPPQRGPRAYCPPPFSLGPDM